MLSIETVHAAQSGDLNATADVITAMEDRIQKLAKKAAKNMRDGGIDRFADDFAQDARVAMWGALERFEGDDIDGFYAFMHRTMSAVLFESASEERNTGADKDALKVFAACMKRANGDTMLAEKLAQQEPESPNGRRLGRDRAHAARLAWEGSLALDETVPGGTEWDSAGTFAGMLASSVGVPEDLLFPEDFASEATRQTTTMVRAVLDTMGAQQRNVLKANFGIAGTPLFTYARGNNMDAELGQHLGLDEKVVKTARAKGFRAFATKFIKTLNADDQTEWEMAYQAERNRWKRQNG